MSKISRIRILNLGYNHDTIKIDDETFDFGLGKKRMMSRMKWKMYLFKNTMYYAIL